MINESDLCWWTAIGPEQYQDTEGRPGRGQDQNWVPVLDSGVYRESVVLAPAPPGGSTAGRGLYRTCCAAVGADLLAAPLCRRLCEAPEFFRNGLDSSGQPSNPPNSGESDPVPTEHLVGLSCSELRGEGAAAGSAQEPQGFTSDRFSGRCFLWLKQLQTGSDVGGPVSVSAPQLWNDDGFQTRHRQNGSLRAEFQSGRLCSGVWSVDTVAEPTPAVWLGSGFRPPAWVLWVTVGIGNSRSGPGAERLSPEPNTAHSCTCRYKRTETHRCVHKNDKETVGRELIFC